ncbi:MAG: cell division protein FtsL [Selenomonadaceae bacterium]|nr:cell division protein FtsL [Selenomonadaceae bacterium]MBQ1509840.1 cell division protein FtsL [Selenomonadaceae bacterium]MBQ1915143.1 cell division protein FtsL [Selenomonadaceae bacterium]MBQ3970606.1 cell division protein FtsL [Selenomonadaceae bacterium]
MEKQEKKKGFDWFLPIIVLIVIYFSSLLISQQFYLNQVSRDQSAADLRLQAAQQENEALRQERDRLEDADYVERIAREDLGLTRAGEIPYSPVKKNGK